jgi:DNA-binding response OmpR family regulator
MPDQPKAIAFDLDSVSLVRLRQAFPAWEIEVINGATLASLSQDWDPQRADLLVVRVQDETAETLGLCRGLRSQTGRAHVPLLVLVPPAQETLVKAALDAGAHSCLVLPIHPKDLATTWARMREGNRPGRHTLNLDRAQREDLWQDNGGEG